MVTRSSFNSFSISAKDVGESKENIWGRDVHVFPYMTMEMKAKAARSAVFNPVSLF